MKILYLSVHSILEAEEILLFHELGHEVFSPGAYWKPESGGDGMRPPIPQIKYKQEWIDSYNKIHDMFPGQDGKYHLTKEVVDYFDVVIVMHQPGFITENWEVLKKKNVIWRTIGQSVASVEQKLEPYRRGGLKIVRYSPRERNIPHYIGEDAVIRFYKDPEIYKGWTGEQLRVITFAQDMQRRGSACNYPFFEEVTRPYKRALFGPNNNQPIFGFGKIPFEQLLSEMRTNRVYFYTGTQPASYTLNFMEALMTGCPIVAIGPQHGNADVWRNHDLYEIQDFIKNGVNGFISDDVFVLRNCINQLLRDKDLANRISTAGRQYAIKLFGKETIKSQWDSFLRSL